MRVPIFERMSRTAGRPAAMIESRRAWARRSTALQTSPAAMAIEDRCASCWMVGRRVIGSTELASRRAGRSELGDFDQRIASSPAPTQREMLEPMVDAYREGDPDLTQPNEDGWLRGDVADIAAEMQEMPPELFEVADHPPQPAWTGWLIDRLERPGTVLFAVGAGHLAGRDSVQSMLEARGFTVRRIH